MPARNAGRRCLVRRSALMIAAPTLLFAAACGDDPAEPQGSDAGAGLAEGLVAILPDGTQVKLNPTEVVCLPSEEDPTVEVLRVFADLDGARIIVQAVPVEGAKSFDLPLSAGDFESGPKNVELFIGAQPDVETSSTEEESSGTLELVRASCDPAELELKVDATLGSETYDGGEVQVEGHLVVKAAE